MKIGSDAVLMGSLLDINRNSHSALEIGTGSGVISLMLAQRYSQTNFTSIEIDLDSSQQAEENFKNSIFSDRIKLVSVDFLSFDSQQKYDLILSNPPYFYHSLKNDNHQKSVARHIDWEIFVKWLDKCIDLSDLHTEIAFILPVEAFEKTNSYLTAKGFHLTKDISIKSFSDSDIIRKLSTWQMKATTLQETEFIIYEAEKQHSQQYIQALKDYLIIF